MTHPDAPVTANPPMPEEGVSRPEVERLLEEVAQDDVTDWEARLMAGGTYPAGDDVLAVAKDAYLRFFSTNPLYAASVFKSSRQTPARGAPSR